MAFKITNMFLLFRFKSEKALSKFDMSRAYGKSWVMSLCQNNNLFVAFRQHRLTLIPQFWKSFEMNQDTLANFGGAVHELFIRWDAFKLAVEHMGGRNGQQVREVRQPKINTLH